jgi:hypothetical protein
MDKPAYVDPRLLNIKRYNNWYLQLHTNQRQSLGKCFAKSKREISYLTEMNEQEINELFGAIIPQLKKAFSQLFNSNEINMFCYEKNQHKNLLWHITPIHSNPDILKKSYGIEFEDNQDIPVETLTQIKNDIASRI